MVMACNSLIYVDAACSQGPNLGLKKAISSSCKRTTPMPTLDVLVSTTNASSKLRRRKIGDSTIALLRASKVEEAERDHLKLSLWRRSVRGAVIVV